MEENQRESQGTGYQETQAVLAESIYFRV
ncbi:rCG24592 [Rattus norvegicus]|uniref:RCG24592 n=1 Tax=Rattus norvegicus TaxID=10116 RepID=A6JC31_RAT|nr:rCG24592 [Rattus norvegicus]